MSLVLERDPYSTGAQQPGKAPILFEEAAVNPVPDLRIRLRNSAPINPDGGYVLYWMIAYRRTHWNFALQRALYWALELNKPLLVLEALRCDYPWASDRLHRFILDGMADTAQHLQDTPVFYYPYVEPARNAGKGLVAALGNAAAVVVTDEFPVFMLPRMVGAAAGQLKVRLEQVDSNGLLPLRAAEKAFTTAYSFRRFLQKELPAHLDAFPAADPLRGIALPPLGALPETIFARWPAVSSRLLQGGADVLEHLPIDHSVSAIAVRGGRDGAIELLDQFLTQRLAAYQEERNYPERRATSGLSPYLHFGHISVHEVFAQLMNQEEWSPAKIALQAKGSRSGWWGISEPAEAFIDQLVTWRELGFNMCALRDDYDCYESLPEWARQTLAVHGRDPRPYVYTVQQFESAATHDPLWNAAQTQLLREGTIHNYLRMLWGKKILEWSAMPRDALQVMIELNNKYALDGRDPNSYTGIFWVLGRYDRPFGPERRIFGKVRYMSSKNTARKMPVQDYISWYAQ